MVTVPNFLQGILDDDEILPVASGTGFVISGSGYLITNNHVIEGCNNVNIHYRGETIPATIVSQDSINDLALLKGKLKPKKVFSYNHKEDGTYLELI